MTNTGTDGGVFRAAAKRILKRENRYSCCAVAGVDDGTDPSTSPEVAKYEKWFKPLGLGAFWAREWDYDDVYSVADSFRQTEEGRRCRVLALCFMAAMAEAGDV